MTSTWSELKFYGALASNQFVAAHDLHKIPGPPVTPGVGHIPHVMRPDYHVQMLEWANEYGGIYKFCLGCQWVVVVSDPAVAAQVLGRGDGSVPRKCIGYQFFDLATNHLDRRSFFTTPDEVHWGAVRKAAAPAFNLNNVRRVFPCVVKYAEIMAQEIGRYYSEQQPPSKQAAPVMSACEVAQATAAAMKEAGTQANATAKEASTQGWNKQDAAPSSAQTHPPVPLNVGITCPNTSSRQLAQQGLFRHVAASVVGFKEGFMEALQDGFKLAKASMGYVAGLIWSVHSSSQPAGSQADGAVGDKFSSQQGDFGAEAGKKAGGIDIQHLLEESLLNVFVEGMFNIQAQDFPGHPVAAAMNLVLEEANERLKIPLRSLFTWIARPAAYAEVRRAQQLLGDTYGYMADVLRSRSLPPDDQDKNLWVCLAKLRDPRTGALLTREQLIPEIGALMMAGFDTSSHTVAWCLFTLAANPGIQAEVRQELKQKGLQHAPGALPPHSLQFEDLVHLPTLNCVIDETMRMYPVAATASVREVIKPTKIGQFVVPKGVIVWPMLYALHNAQHNWDHPEIFRLERWHSKHFRQVDQHGMPAGEVASVRQPKSFLPFSDGMKNCLGQNLGLMEVRTVLVTLLSRFHFVLDQQMGGADDVIHNMIMSLTLKMKGGLRVHCIPLGTEQTRTMDAKAQARLSPPVPETSPAAAPQAAPAAATAAFTPAAPDSVAPYGAQPEALVPESGLESPMEASLEQSSVGSPLVPSLHEEIQQQLLLRAREEQPWAGKKLEERVSSPAKLQPHSSNSGCLSSAFAQRSSGGMWGRFLV